MKWISAKERLPDHRQHVLVWGSYDSIGEESYEMIIYKCKYDANDDEFQQCGPRDSNEGWLPIVTHWMPLPEPPVLED